MKSSSPILKTSWNWLLAILAIAGGLKLGLVLVGAVPFNSDEAVVALMARHILGGEKPIFFYGQAYMGSLDAWLVAGGFRIFGEAVWVIRLLQGLLYAGTIVTTAWIGRLAFKDHRVGLLAALLLAIPTVNITLYTTASLGGYGEALLLGNLLLLTGLKIGRQLKSAQFPPWYLWLLLGFIGGLGLWAFGLTLVYALPVGIYLIIGLFRYQKTNLNLQGRWRSWVASLAAMTFGALLGSLPWWLYAMEHGFGQLISELTGGALADVEKLPLFVQIGQHIFNFFVLGITVIFGLRPPWAITWLGLPLAPFVLVFWLATLWWMAKVSRQRDDQRADKILLIGVMLSLFLSFVLSPFGADPSGRYFLPLALPMVLFGADLITTLRARYGKLAWGLVGLLLIQNLWGTIQSVQLFPPGITTQFDATTQIDQRKIGELTSFLRQEGETRGYTNYWVTYPLAFLSDEELIFIPRLPYHRDFRYTPRDDRYAPYDAQVASSPRVAYITTKFPELDDYLRDHFSALNLSWEETQIGDYHVFFHLSDRVEPGEIGLDF